MNICIEAQLLNYRRRSGLMTYTEGLINSLYRANLADNYTLGYYSLTRQAHNMPGPSGEHFRKVVLRVPAGEFRFRGRLIDDIVLPYFLKKNNIRVFHRPNGYTIPSIKSVFKILTVHDLRTLTIGDTLWAQNVEHYHQSLKKVDVCAVVSECTKQDLIRHFKLREDKIKVVHLAADERFRPIAQERIDAVKTKYNIRERFFLSIGSVPRKNIDGIIRGFAQSRHHKDYLLVLSCNMDIQKYQALVATLGVHNRVIILDQLTDDEVVALYNGCHCFVFPSLYEGFGLPILEAMQCGAPVITSDMSSCCEVAGDAALLVNPKNIQEIADAIDEICNNESRRQQLITKGFEQSGRFSWKRFALEMMKIYELA